MSNSGEKMPATSEGDEVPVKEVINDILNGIEKIIPTSTSNNSGEKESGENVHTTAGLDESNIALGQKRGQSDNQFSNKKQKSDDLSADAVLKDIVKNSDFKSAKNILDSFNGFAKQLFSDVNNFVNDTRSYINSVSEIASKTTSKFVHNTEPLINVIHEQGLIALSSAYDGYLKATRLMSNVKDSLGFQNIDTIILEHEKMACIALLELVFEKQSELIDSTTSDEKIKTLITHAMTPDINYIDKQQQVLTHIEMALRVYFILKYGKSAVEDMSIIASKGIYNDKGELLVVPRNTSEMMRKYVKEDLDSRITTILNKTEERNYFLKEIVDNILKTPGTEPSIDHSKYYGKPSTANDFINNIFSHIGTRINSLNASFDYYKSFIDDEKKTGDTIYSALNKLKDDLQTLQEDLLKQHLKFKGVSVNTLINNRSRELRTKIIKLKNEMDAHLQEIARRKEDGMESSGGKKTRRRKATSSRRVSLRKRKSKRDKRSNQSKGTLKKKHSKKHKA